MVQAFIEALACEGPNPIIPAQHDLFGQFVGSWDFEWVRGMGTPDERRAIGEWLFARVLNGTAVQDVFIVPSRTENAINPQPDAEYGTTIRIYNPVDETWDIFYGATGEMVRLNAVKENEKIVLTEITGKQMKWVFSEITDDNFHWQHLKTNDRGRTWYTHIDIFAKRKKSAV